MKVIDLLNKIANGEELPQKIAYDEKVYRVSKNFFTDVENETFLKGFLIEQLNDEVEVLEEDKEIEELDFYKITDETIAGLRKSINILNNEYVDKINELVKAVNELKKGK